MSNTEKVYDIIVIGSGMGGLTFASLMAQLAGKRVLVLERHFKLGGYTHTFSRNGYKWDVGIHYVGQMAKHQDCRHLFDLVTQAGVEWQRMPDKFDQFNYPDFAFKVDADPAIYKADLIKQFPEDARAIRQYFKDVVRVETWFRNELAQSMTPALVRWAMRKMSAADKAFAMQTTQTYLDKNFKSNELKALLTSEWGDCGLPPAKSPFALTALIVSHYFGGGYYPIGSGKSICDAIVPIIKANGGDCFINHKVEQIIVEKGRVKGVEVTVKQGAASEAKTFLAPIVVSNAGNAITFGELVPAKYRAPMPEKVSNDICSSVTVYLGLKTDPRTLGFKGENHWIFESYDHNSMFDNTLATDGGKAGGCFLSFPSLKDPVAQKHTAEIIGFLKYDEFEKWNDTEWKNRGAEYGAFKDRITKTLIDTVEAKFPGFSAMIDYSELSTPLTITGFTGHHKGAIYGHPMTAEEFNKRTYSPKTPIKNLYVTGADVVSLGIMGALMGGVVTASHLLGTATGYFTIMGAAKNLAEKLDLEARLRESETATEVEEESKVAPRELVSP